MTTALNTRSARKVGDKVTIDDPKFPGVWTVKNLGPKNATLDLNGRALRCPYYLLKEATAVDLATVTAVPLPAYFHEGEFVRVTAGRFAGLYVVIKDSGRERVNIAKLGGDNGRYVRMDKRSVTKVDPADVLK
jgi:hypothetical protein